MKFSKFDYARPNSVIEAIAMLEADEDAKIIAGGQSLLPSLAFRLSAPTKLIDIGGLADLAGIEIDSNGVRLGARVRWCDIEKSSALAEAHPLLVAMIAHVAHYQIRNRGTVGGSLANADPSAEMPGLAVVTDADIVIMGPKGTRVESAAKFFPALLETTLRPSEIITEVRLPSWPKTRRWGFEEFARRKGDFALAGIAVYYDPDDEGRAHDVHIGVIGADTRPRRLAKAEAAIEGQSINLACILEVSKIAAAEVEPMSDIHGDAEYRRSLVDTLLERALRGAAGIVEE